LMLEPFRGWTRNRVVTAKGEKKDAAPR